MTSSPEIAGRPGSSPPRTEAGSRGRLPSLTGMRFLCAALVFGLHSTLLNFFASKEASGKYAAMVGQGGFTGVVYFFILSGFVLTWSARSGDRLGAFWRRRFFKIYPSYLVALMGGILFAVFAGGAIKDPVIAQGLDLDWTRVVKDVLLVQSWSSDVLVRTSFNQPLWSLSAEALMYLCFPLLLILINKVRPERLWAGAGAVIAAIIAIPAIVHVLPPGDIYPTSPLTGNEVWLDLHFPATRLLDFVLGIFLARIVMTGRRLPLGLGGSVALTVLAYWLSAYVPMRFNVVAIMVIPLALLIAAAAAQDSAGRKSFVSGRVWVWLGEISFAFYLLHFLVMMVARRVLGERQLGSPAAFGLLAGLFLVTIVLAWLLHTLVELPMMRRFSRSSRDRAESAAAAEPPAEPAPADRPAELERHAA
jgi:peptidoglycan/LPS O-acetylase OafA/YrhL